MVVLRLVLRPDRRLVVAALGAGMAILVPVAGTLVLAGLESDVAADAGWLMVPHERDGLVPIREGGDPRAAVLYTSAPAGDGVRFVVPLRGASPPDGVAWTGRPTAETVAWGGQLLRLQTHPPIPLASAQDIVVPGTAGSLAHAVLYDHPVPGAVPAHGSDAFEWAGVEGLKQSMGFLVVASLPLVVIVAGAFADQDARRHAHTAATFSALGRPDVGRRIVAARAILVASMAATIAALLGALLWAKGGSAFHPPDTPKDLVALAIALPAVAGAAAGVWLGVRRVGNANAQLRTHPQPPRSWRVPLPLLWRPLLVGSRIAPVLVLAALLFVLDVGFPMAASAIPASVAGGGDEWVEGAEADIVTGGRVPAARGHVLMHHPDVDASIAEILLPTMVHGDALMVRGGRWAEFETYYDLHLQGDASGLVLGDRAARRLGVGPGDVVSVQASSRPEVSWVDVTGILRGHRVLEDEAVLPEHVAQGLAGVANGTATVVRIRPDTEAAKAAMYATEGRVEVLSVHVPPGARVSTLVPVSIDVVNLGGGTAERLLAVRIGGSVAAEVPIGLGGWQRATVVAPVLIPPGGGAVTVNPTTETEAVDNPVTIRVPDQPFTGEPFVVLVDGADGGRIEAYPDLDAWQAAASPLAAATVVEGSARLTVSRPGDAMLVVENGSAVLRATVLDGTSRDVGRIEILHVWIDGSHATGQRTTLHAELQNLGGAPATEAIDIFLDETRLAVHDVTLGAGERRDIEVPFLYQPGQVRVEDRNLTVSAPDTTGPEQAPDPPPPSRVSDSVALREAIADRVLGDARQALGGLGAVALASSLSVVYLGVDRSLAERIHVRGLMEALGGEPGHLRRRVAWEAAVMGALALLAGIALGSLLFLLLGAIGWPTPFAHSIQVPFGAVFIVQAATMFGGACAMAAYLAVGRQAE